MKTFLALLLLGAVCAQDTALHNAARANNVEGVAAALKAGDNINQRGGGGQSPLMAATLAGAPAAVKLLLAEGADAAVAENDGYNPPHGAGFQGRAEVLRELVKAGVGIHNKHKDGFYPIHRACWGMDVRHTDTVKAFIEAGEPHDLAADNGQTCRDMTRNEGTRRMLEAVRDQKGEL